MIETMVNSVMECVSRVLCLVVVVVVVVAVNLYLNSVKNLQLY